MSGVQACVSQNCHTALLSLSSELQSHICTLGQPGGDWEGETPLQLVQSRQTIFCNADCRALPSLLQAEHYIQYFAPWFIFSDHELIVKTREKMGEKSCHHRGCLICLMSGRCHVARVSCSIFSIIRKESERRLHLRSEQWVWQGGVTVTMAVAAPVSAFLHNCDPLDTQVQVNIAAAPNIADFFYLFSLLNLSTQFLKDDGHKSTFFVTDRFKWHAPYNPLSNPVSWR